VVKDAKTGEITEVRCTYDPETKSGGSQNQRKVKGTIHWVSARHAVNAEVRLYDRLFNVEDPGGKEWQKHINPKSIETLTDCKVEPALAGVKKLDRFQFERLGYFCVDSDSTENHLVFNRTVTLRDSWAKIEKS
ncbi:MAG TPA: glutamine--tRNA ligase, partial [Bacteroidota bacterium]|nr:glutamine--tRNA ligase [Bacteroidota bacterium]